jgi:hypothetical protein
LCKFCPKLAYYVNIIILLVASDYIYTQYLFNVFNSFLCLLCLLCLFILLNVNDLYYEIYLKY